MIDNLTFVIFAKNEESRIENVILNFINYGKILIADGGSTDNTIEIAKKYGCKYYVRRHNYDIIENQEIANELYEHIDTDWIYWGYTDELIPKGTLLEIKKHIESNNYDIISVVRKNYYYGQFCYDMYKSRSNRVFRKHAISFIANPIHSFGKTKVPKSKILKLNADFHFFHFISYTSTQYSSTISRYSQYEQSICPKWHYSLLYYFYSFLYDFLKEFLYHKGYKAGFRGLALLYFNLFYNQIKVMRAYEIKNGITTEKIHLMNNQNISNLLLNIEKT